MSWKFDHTFAQLPNMDRYFVGADRVMKKLADIADQSVQVASKYPPYNIKKVDEDRYVIEMAVAGFGKNELDIELADSKLKISGNVKSDDTSEYLFKGIAERGFSREFTLADNVEVKSSSLVNGMLKIWLEAFVPEDKKPKKINIEDTETDGAESTAEFLVERGEK
jgi:molecular chaperone IbpA